MDNKPKNHVVITGTGRAGTTFLVELLTHLKLDTGFLAKDIKANKNEVANAGLELRIGDVANPYIVKDTWFCDYAQEVIDRPDIEIDYVFIPMRKIEAVSASRRLNNKLRFSKLKLVEKLKYLIWPYPFEGGLKDTRSMKKGKQEAILLNKFHNLLLVLSKKNIPITFIHFPEMTINPMYLYQKLKPILKDIEFDDFNSAYQETIQPNLIHKFTSNNI
jgi:hypothetical protein